MVLLDSHSMSHVVLLSGCVFFDRCDVCCDKSSSERDNCALFVAHARAHCRALLDLVLKKAIQYTLKRVDTNEVIPVNGLMSD